MSGDARVIAFMAAWNRVEQATKYREEFREAESKRSIKDYRSPLPPEYDALMAEADVFARLATVSDPWIGLAAMEHLERIEEAREAERAEEETFRDFVAKRSDETVEDWHGKAGGSA